jgi:hypothetical protein
MFIGLLHKSVEVTQLGPVVTHHEAHVADKVSYLLVDPIVGELVVVFTLEEGIEGFEGLLRAVKTFFRGFGGAKVL